MMVELSPVHGFCTFDSDISDMFRGLQMGGGVKNVIFGQFVFNVASVACIYTIVY